MIQIKPVASEAAWEMAKAIRQRVFVEEQQCPPEEEWDVYDETSRHFLGLLDGQPVGTARWRTAVYEQKLVAKLERFAVLPAYRGRGYGRRLVQVLIADARRAGFHTFLLHAQAHLEPFYTAMGFDRVGERFMEAGIPHVKMIRREEQGRLKDGQGGVYGRRD